MKTVSIVIKNSSITGSKSMYTSTCKGAKDNLMWEVCCYVDPGDIDGQQEQAKHQPHCSLYQWPEVTSYSRHALTC